MLIVCSPLCLNWSTCVITANSRSGDRSAFCAVIRCIMPRGEAKNKSAYQHILHSCSHPHSNQLRSLLTDNIFSRRAATPLTSGQMRFLHDFVVIRLVSS